MFLTLSREEQLRLQGLAARCKGITYKYGAEVLDLSIEPERIHEIDCSELIQYLYHKIGYDVVDGASNQFAASKDTTDVDVGDLVFKKFKGVVCHVGMVISVESKTVMIIEASGSFKKVVVRTLSDFKIKPAGVAYAGIRRLLFEKVKPIKK